MKVLLLLVLINALQISLKCEDLPDTNVSVNTKIKGKPLRKGIDIVNVRKIGKIKKYRGIKEKKLQTNPEMITYTAFPPLDTNNSDTQVENERTSRVKKVLPDYGRDLLRKKRSLNKTSNNIKLKRRKNPKKCKKNKSQKKKSGGGKGASRKKGKKSKRSNNRAGNYTVRLFNATKIKRTHFYRHNKGGINRLKNITRAKDPRNPAAAKKNTGILIHKKKASTTKVSALWKGTGATKPSTKKAIAKPLPSKSGAKKVNAKLTITTKTQATTKTVYGRRLIAGRDATIETYPYVVSIQKDREHWCSGALLNQRLVITTANCLWKASRLSRLRIRAGTRHSDTGGQVAKIAEVMKHPLWRIRGPPDYDLSLILLDRYIKFSNKVHSVDLPNQAMMPPFDDAWVTSWGSERRDGIFEGSSHQLQVYHARLIDLPKCNNVTQRFGVTVTSNFICLAQTGKNAPCTRDTGAPAVSDGILWGLASWGIRKLCGTERYPAMFSYTASPSNIDFITNATVYLMSDERFYPYKDGLKPQDMVVTSDNPLPQRYHDYDQ